MPRDARLLNDTRLSGGGLSTLNRLMDDQNLA